jgi:hypothetical protein
MNAIMLNYTKDKKNTRVGVGMAYATIIKTFKLKILELRILTHTDGIWCC